MIERKKSQSGLPRPRILHFDEVYARITRWNVLRLDYVVSETSKATEILPPSDNNIRVPVFGQGMKLTGEAKKFKRSFVKALAPQIVESEELDPDGLYFVTYLLGFPSWEFEPHIRTHPRMTWKKKGTLKKQDTTERLKLVQDAVAELGGLDDHRFIAIAASRFENPYPYLGIRIHELDWQGFYDRPPGASDLPARKARSQAARDSTAKKKGG